MRAPSHPVVAQIEKEVAQTLRNFGYELVLMKFGGPRHNQTLSVYIDKPGGVTTNDCQYVAERLSVLLDVLDPIPGRYSLVVSSPGLDRPLTREEDFDRFAGQQAAVTYRSGEGQRVTIQGKLEGRQGEEALLALGERTEHIPLREIEEAHLVYEWQEAD